MTTVEQLEQQVRTLPREDLLEFHRWLAEFVADMWDEQIEADAAAGKLDHLAAEALAEYERGEAREL
jgi:hypothetical protein